MARKCYLQHSPVDLFSSASSSGGGLPGRLRLERVAALVNFCREKKRGRRHQRRPCSWTLQSSMSADFEIDRDFCLGFDRLPVLHIGFEAPLLDRFPGRIRQDRRAAQDLQVLNVAFPADQRIQ